MVSANSSDIKVLASAIGFDLSGVSLHDRKDVLTRYMTRHKTVWSLRLALSSTQVKYPKYILDAIEFVRRSS